MGFIARLLLSFVLRWLGRINNTISILVEMNPHKTTIHIHSTHIIFILLTYGIVYCFQDEQITLHTLEKKLCDGNTSSTKHNNMF